MKCPKCGKRELRIDVTFQGTVDVTFAEDGEDFEVTDSEPTDSEWTDESGVRCFGCEHTGTVAEFEAAETKVEAHT